MKLKLTLIILILVLSFQTAFSNTDGTELKVTDQPDKLILQLGKEWAGTKFELRTDAGIYPGQIEVSENGILTMELGGSKTYTLSCLNSAKYEVAATPTLASEPEQEIIENNQDKIPKKYILIYVGGLFLFSAAWFLFVAIKKKKQHNSYDEDENQLPD